MHELPAWKYARIQTEENKWRKISILIVYWVERSGKNCSASNIDDMWFHREPLYACESTWPRYRQHCVGFLAFFSQRMRQTVLTGIRSGSVEKAAMKFVKLWTKRERTIALCLYQIFPVPTILSILMALKHQITGFNHFVHNFWPKSLEQSDDGLISVIGHELLRFILHICLFKLCGCDLKCGIQHQRTMIDCCSPALERTDVLAFKITDHLASFSLDWWVTATGFNPV